MFEYTRSGLALNALIAAIQKGDTTKATDMLAKLIRYQPEHIVDNFLGNLKAYEKLDDSLVQERRVCAVKAMELVERVIPEISGIIDLRMAQSHMIADAVAAEDCLSKQPSREELKVRKKELKRQAEIEKKQKEIDEWRRKNC